MPRRYTVSPSSSSQPSSPFSSASFFFDSSRAFFLARIVARVMLSRRVFFAPSFPPPPPSLPPESLPESDSLESSLSLSTAVSRRSSRRLWKACLRLTSQSLSRFSTSSTAHGSFVLAAGVAAATERGSVWCSNMIETARSRSTARLSSATRLLRCATLSPLSLALCSRCHLMALPSCPARSTTMLHSHTSFSKTVWAPSLISSRKLRATDSYFEPMTGIFLRTGSKIVPQFAAKNFSPSSSSESPDPSSSPKESNPSSSSSLSSSSLELSRGF
mmetsp:Transcript_15220/g.35231  ORF Transcript_15220/g.35231 Transcript_15220/m.35231 type:complete len:274 (-) Transcript_15220:458-1279(-)